MRKKILVLVLPLPLIKRLEGKQNQKNVGQKFCILKILTVHYSCTNYDFGAKKIFIQFDIVAFDIPQLYSIQSNSLKDSFKIEYYAISAHH